MDRFRHTVLLISLLVFAADCGTDKIKIPYDRIQVQVFSKPSDRMPLFYAPAARLLSSTMVSAFVTVEPDTNCLFGSVTITQEEQDDWDFTVYARDQAAWTIYSRVGKYSGMKLKWMLVGHSTNDSTPTTTTSAWQFLTDYDPKASVRIACPTDATYNETMTALQNNSTTFASRLFVAFAIDSNVRSAPLCFDTKHFPNNTVAKFLAERLSTGQNYMYMGSGFGDLLESFLAAAIEMVLRENEFIAQDEMNRIQMERKMYYLVFPHNTTTTANFTSDMWEASYWTSERPDIKARRLDAVLSGHEDWVREMLNGTRSAAPTPVMQAYNEVLEDHDLYFTDRAKYTSGKVHLYVLYVFYVNLELFRQNTPICIGNVTVTTKGKNYTAVVPASVGERIVFDDGTILQ